MKKNIIISLLSAMTTFILCSNLHAQVSIRSVGMTSDIVTLNNASVRVNNLFIMDSLAQDGEHGSAKFQSGEIMHRASFEVELGSMGAVNMLKTIYPAVQAQPLPGLTLHKLNSQEKSVEERNYSTVDVKEIIFPELIADSREIPRAKVTIHANDVFYKDKGGGRIQTDGDNRSKMAAGNRFRLMIDNLPTQKVVRIGSIRVGNIHKASSDEYLYFSIDISSEDAKPWYDWLNSRPGNKEYKQATISLLNETAQEIFSLQLSQVEIVSVSSLSNPDSIPKTTIGLRTKNIPNIQ